MNIFSCINKLPKVLSCLIILDVEIVIAIFLFLQRAKLKFASLRSD